MLPKANTATDPQQPPRKTISGGLVMIGILVVAVAAAATSWWFRYNATHRAAKFWGPEAAKLIRDATQVTVHYSPFISNETSMRANGASKIDVSHAHGLTHLRNALLEDQSFDWTTADNPMLLPPEKADTVYWFISFHDLGTGKDVTIWLTDDFRRASHSDAEHKAHSVSTAPIAKGLREMFAEFSSNSTSAK
jgi:hypothetical protein